MTLFILLLTSSKYSYSICWYLSWTIDDVQQFCDCIRTASVDIYLKSILVILLGNQCIRTAPVDIYCIKYVLRIKYVCIRTAPVNVYLKMLKRIDFYKALYSYSTCWCLSNTKIVGNRTNVTYSYRTCWCLSYPNLENKPAISIVFVQHLLMFIQRASCLVVRRSEYSYSTCWCLSYTFCKNPYLSY